MVNVYLGEKKKQFTACPAVPYECSRPDEQRRGKLLWYWTMRGDSLVCMQTNCSDCRTGPLNRDEGEHNLCRIAEGDTKGCNTCQVRLEMN